MAFTGFHIVFGYAANSTSKGPAALIESFVSAETMASAGTSTAVAPAISSGHGRPVAILRASADSFYTVGPTPADPSNASSPRDLITAGERLELFVRPGDKIRWSLA